MITAPTRLNEQSKALLQKPSRTCCVTRQSLTRQTGLRFVADPAGQIVFDVLNKLPGRGVWVSANRACVEKAVGQQAFARGLKSKVNCAGDLANKVEQALLKTAQDQLSLAKKSGQLILGADGINRLIDKGRTGTFGCLIQAANSDETPRMALARRVLSHRPDTRWAGGMSGEELGKALGLGFVAHILLKSGKLLDLWHATYTKLSGFRDIPEITWKKRLIPINTNRA